MTVWSAACVADNGPCRLRLRHTRGRRHRLLTDNSTTGHFAAGQNSAEGQWSDCVYPFAFPETRGQRVLDSVNVLYSTYVEAENVFADFFG
jgi:hypothetical protein